MVSRFGSPHVYDMAMYGGAFSKFQIEVSRQSELLEPKTALTSRTAYRPYRKACKQPGELGMNVLKCFPSRILAVLHFRNLC